MMKKKNRNGFWSLGAKDLVHPKDLGAGFTAISGEQVLPIRLVRECRKCGQDIIVISWPCRNTPSYLEVKNVATLVFVSRGAKLEFRVWDPFDERTGSWPNIEFKNKEVIIEIYDLDDVLQSDEKGFNPEDPTDLTEYPNPEFGLPVKVYFRGGYTPLPSDLRERDKFGRVTISANRKRLYFRRENATVIQLAHLADEYPWY